MLAIHDERPTPLPAVTRESLASEDGRAFFGERFAHAWLRKRTWSVVLWDALRLADMQQLLRSLPCELERHVGCHTSIVDARRVSSVEPAAFDALQDYVESSFDPLTQAVSALAIVRGAGMVGASVAGFFDVVRAPYPVAVLSTVEAALDFLDANGPRTEGRPAVEWQLDEIAMRGRGIDPLVAGVRTIAAEDTPEVTLERLARRLGRSERTIQRRLGAHGTTWRAELVHVRLARARELLATEAPITEIAFTVGFQSSQSFGSWFRKHAAETPTDYREARRSSSRAC
jgi:AraC-like DNA-binding protein